MYTCLILGVRIQHFQLVRAFSQLQSVLLNHSFCFGACMDQCEAALQDTEQCTPAKHGLEKHCTANLEGEKTKGNLDSTNHEKKDFHIPGGCPCS